MVQVIPATSPSDVELARELFKEYQTSLGIDLCFQGFDKELAELPGEYASPTGRLFLAYDGYARMRLDSLPSMMEAITLYGRQGFQSIEPYRPNPVEGSLFLELVL